MAYQQRTARGVFPGRDYQEITERKRRGARGWLVVVLAVLAVLIGVGLLARFAAPPGTVPVPEYEYRGR